MIGKIFNKDSIWFAGLQFYSKTSVFIELTLDNCPAFVLEKLFVLKILVSLALWVASESVDKKVLCWITINTSKIASSQRVGGTITIELDGKLPRNLISLLNPPPRSIPSSCSVPRSALDSANRPTGTRGRRPDEPLCHNF